MLAQGSEKSLHDLLRLLLGLKGGVHLKVPDVAHIRHFSVHNCFSIHGTVRSRDF
jgi:hypothetical protein